MLPNLPFGLAHWATLLLGTVYSIGLPISRSGLHIRSLYGASTLRSSYDYVIVGAGTSGLTVADRLSADGKCEISESYEDYWALLNAKN